MTLLSLTLLVSGCGKTGTENVVKDFTSKVNDSKSYTLKGNMEIYADEETFTYSLEINFLKRYIQLFEEGDKTVKERREILVEQRKILKEKLDAMQEAYNRLNYKIDLYDKNILDKKLM